jgi:hypothetical protein
MESLKDLGPDTLYTSGEAITAQKEAEFPQSQCTPITDWRFTLGRGYQSKAVIGPWGALSNVTNPFNTSIVTAPSVPLLNDQGSQVGDQTLAGAVTIELSPEQAQLAVTPNTLWIQGGTTDDPVLDKVYPHTYAFGALRCGIDNLNGDNVEWISYPTGARHVFCYAYYVVPPPTSGTIIVRKQADGPAGQPSENFRFVGNISYNEDNSFVLAAAPGSPGETTFYRAGAASWDFAEQVPAGWQLTAITCTSATGQSVATTDLATAKTTVALANSDIVTCTYSDRLTPPASGLLLRKITRGGIGTFGFSVDPTAAGPTRSARATTSVPGVAVAATPAFTDLAPGGYSIGEVLPRTAAGTWRLEQVVCNGRDRGSANPIGITLIPGAGSICTFQNRFTPAGEILLRKSTRGGTGTAGFVIDALGATPARRYTQAATTTAQNAPVVATGSDTTRLPLGTYEITETSPASSATSAWHIDSVACDGVAVPAEQGSIRITLTADNPAVDCTFANVLSETPTVPETVTGGEAASTTPKADLSIIKRAEHRVIRLGQSLHYVVTVTNRGQATARNVTLVEEIGDPKAILSATPARYRCSPARRPPSCLIGALAPGQTATVTVLARPRVAGRRPNRAVVNSSTAESTRANNVARSAVIVMAPARFTG